MCSAGRPPSLPSLPHRAAEASGSAAGPVRDAGPLVFIVSGDAAVRRALVILLETEGFRTRPFAVTATFLADAAAMRAMPVPTRRCLVIEQRSRSRAGPGESDLIECLAAAGIALPMIILAVASGSTLHRRAVAAGVPAVLVDPSDPQALLQAIAAALGDPVAR